MPGSASTSFGLPAAGRGIWAAGLQHIRPTAGLTSAWAKAKSLPIPGSSDPAFRGDPGTLQPRGTAGGRACQLSHVVGAAPVRRRRDRGDRVHRRGLGRNGGARRRLGRNDACGAAPRMRIANADRAAEVAAIHDRAHAVCCLARGACGSRWSTSRKSYLARIHKVPKSCNWVRVLREPANEFSWWKPYGLSAPFSVLVQIAHQRCSGPWRGRPWRSNRRLPGSTSRQGLKLTAHSMM